MLVLFAVLLGGCSHGVVYQLTEGSRYSDRDDCARIPKRAKPQLGEYLTKLAPKMTDGVTGVHVLEDGAGALMARAWLAANATQSIDIQYFIFSSDDLGLIATDELLLAAERGVKVRLLVDDLLHDGDALLLLALDKHPNIEIRIYNPNINIGKSLPKKLFNIARDFRGANQRMHNKTFIVDGEVVITGGRNIADEYFDFSMTYNFRDRDVLLIGGTANAVNTSFNQFWTHSLAVPLIKVIDEPVDHEKVWQQLHRFACRPDNYWPEVRERARRVPERFKQLQQNGTLRWIEGVRYVSDDPGKNDGSAGLSGGGKTTDALIKLIRSAQKEVIIQTPYLVTTKLGKGLFRETVKRGVTVKIMTNSLASTDSFPAFSGYARDRESLLKTGVEIYELKPDAPVAKSLMTSGLIEKTNLKVPFSLHAKTMVIDGQILMVGTFNLDPRSANLNTECVVILDDTLLAGKVREHIIEEMEPQNAWRITLDSNPDEHAPFSHKWKVFWARPISKEIL